jgi:hypothetical protein
MSLVKIPIFDISFRNDGNGTLQAGCRSFSLMTQRERPMADGVERFASLLGRAAMEVWGDMPRDIQEALFETAMRGHDADREELARLLHDRHPRTLHPSHPAKAE